MLGLPVSVPGPDRQPRLRLGRAGDRLGGAGHRRSAISMSRWPAAWRTWISLPISWRAAAGAIAWATASFTTACCATGSTTRSPMHASGWHTEDLVEKFQLTPRGAGSLGGSLAAALRRGPDGRQIQSARSCLSKCPARRAPTRSRRTRHNRPDTTLEVLARLKPAFRPNGTITAGNAPGLNRRRAAMVLADAAWAEKRGLAPVARLVAYGIAAVEPGMFGLGPVPGRAAGVGARRLESRPNRARRDQRGLRRDRHCGGARAGTARGHRQCRRRRHRARPSDRRDRCGAHNRLIHSMRRDGLKRGLVTLCIGGGQGIALAIEALH